MGPNLRSVDYVESTLNGKDSNCALLVYASTSVVMKEWDFMQQQKKSCEDCEQVGMSYRN